MKQIWWFIFLFLAVACREQPTTTKAKDPTIVLIFKDAPAQEWKGKSAPRKIVYYKEYEESKNFTPSKIGFDTLRIHPSRMITEITHVYHDIERIAVPLVQGDTVLVTYDAKGFPLFESRSDSGYTLGYNFPSTIFEYRLPSGHRPEILKNDAFYRLYDKYVQQKDQDGIGRINHLFDMGKYYVHPDTMQNWTDRSRSRYAAELDSRYQRGDLPEIFYRYYKDALTYMACETKLRTEGPARPSEQDELLWKRRTAYPLLSDSNLWMHAYRSLLYEMSCVPYRGRPNVSIAEANRSRVTLVKWLLELDSIPKGSKRFMLIQWLGRLSRDVRNQSIWAYTEKSGDSTWLSLLADTIPEQETTETPVTWNADSCDLRLIDLSGNRVNFKTLLAQSLGKVVYLDFWASWCGPCKDEMPEAKKLREAYKNREITFVYIAISDGLAAWRQAVKEVQTDYLGNNYIVDNNHSKTLRKELRVGLIPRFMIFDKTGTLVNTDAPRPSSPDIRKVLDRYLK